MTHTHPNHEKRQKFTAPVRRGLGELDQVFDEQPITAALIEASLRQAGCKTRDLVRFRAWISQFNPRKSPTTPTAGQEPDQEPSSE